MIKDERVIKQFRKDLGIEPTILYEDSTGTNGKITLSESKNNFRYLVITARNTSSMVTLTTIVDAKMAYFNLGDVYSASGSNLVGFYSKVYNMTSTTLEVNQYSTYYDVSININSKAISLKNTDVLNIIKVVGYK